MQKDDEFISKIDQERLSRKAFINPSYSNTEKDAAASIVRSYQENKPWGRVSILDEGRNYKIRRIEISPKKRTSLQRHFHRNEFIFVVSGTAFVSIEDQSSNIQINEFLNIPKLTSHRIENPGVIDLILMEFQSGEYLGDDDIIMIEDDYGRAGTEGDIQ